MENLKTSYAMAARIMAFQLFAFSAASTAFGQVQTIARVNIPFSFSVGTKTLPAGFYSFKADNIGLIVQASSGESFREQIIARVSGPVKMFRDGSLVFEKSDSGPILSEVWEPGMKGILVHSIPKGHHRTVIISSLLSETRAVSGKTAFSLTCAKCHGEDGKGDPAADKFFNTAIPKLASAEVQSKTDDELKTIIATGGKIMPPVEIDESGFQHRLPPQDVEAVIAYVRSLKK